MLTAAEVEGATVAGVTVEVAGKDDGGGTDIV